MTRLGLFCDRILEAGWLAALVTVPLYFNIFSSRSFEPDKIIALRSIVLIMCFAYLVKLAERSGAESEDVRSPAKRLGRFARLRSTNPLALPAFAFAVIYVISTALSINSDVSLWGSYQRLQGMYSTLTYLALFFIVAHNLRSKAQVDRFIKVALLTSVPISIYCFAQSQRWDPLMWSGDVSTRVTATMGNAIFVAAYLIMIVPLTLSRLADTCLSLRNLKQSPSVSDLTQVAVPSFLVAFQSVLLLLFLSNGAAHANLWWGALPVVGAFLVISLGVVAPPRRFYTLLAEAIAYGLLLIIQLAAIFLTQSRGPLIGLGVGVVLFALLFASRLGSRRATRAAVAFAAALLAFVVVFNFPNSPLAPLRNAPYIGRLGQLMETEGGTGKVRLLIWEGAIKLITDHPSVGLKSDPLSIWRPLIGYGPDTMSVAFNKVYPPELAHYEARNSSPDRSHMDLLDKLVMTGLLGMISFVTVLYVGLSSAWQTVKRATSPPVQILLIGIFSAVLAHLVEMQVGIAIASTLTYLWALLGLSVAVRRMTVTEETSTEETYTEETSTEETSPSSAPSVSTSPSMPIIFAGYVGATIVGLVYLFTERTDLPVEIATVAGFIWFAVGVVVAALAFAFPKEGRFWSGRNWWIYVPAAAAVSIGILSNLNVVAADTYFKRGFGAEAMGRWNQSIAAYQSALRLAPQQDYYYLFLGRAFMESGRNNQRPRLTPSLAATGGLVRSISHQDLARLGKDDLLDLSSASLREALAINPLNTDHYANLGRLYRYWGAEVGDLNKFGIARDYYGWATTVSPQSAHLWSEWAELLLRSGLPGEALAKARRGAELDPRYPNNFLYLGDAYLELGRTEEALVAHLQALEIDPLTLSDPGLESRVAAYVADGTADKLVAVYEKAVQSERGRSAPSLRSAYGFVLSMQGKLKEGLNEFQIWAQLAPDDWLAHRNLGISYEKLGMIDEAIVEATQAKSLAPAAQQQTMQRVIDELQARKKL